MSVAGGVFLLLLAPGVFAQGKEFPLDTTGSCVTASCHAGIHGKKHVHEAAKDDGSCVEVCHTPVKNDRHAFPPPPADQSPLCSQCHEEGKFRGKSAHGPAAAGKCTACHDPHASEEPRLLRKTGTALCFSCHSASLKDPKGRPIPPTKRLFEDKQAVLHPPFADAECGTCHRPHAS